MKHKCNICQETLCDDSQSSDNQSKIFTHFKAKFKSPDIFYEKLKMPEIEIINGF